MFLAFCLISTLTTTAQWAETDTDVIVVGGAVVQAMLSFVCAQFKHLPADTINEKESHFPENDNQCLSHPYLYFQLTTSSS